MTGLETELRAFGAESSTFSPPRRRGGVKSLSQLLPQIPPTGLDGSPFRNSPEVSRREGLQPRVVPERPAQGAPDAVRGVHESVLEREGQPPRRAQEGEHVDVVVDVGDGPDELEDCRWCEECGGAGFGCCLDGA